MLIRTLSYKKQKDFTGMKVVMMNQMNLLNI